MGVGLRNWVWMWVEGIGCGWVDVGLVMGLRNWVWVLRVVSHNISFYLHICMSSVWCITN